jgi:DNA-binding transcriptional LysR family regulator
MVKTNGLLIKKKSDWKSPPRPNPTTLENKMDLHKLAVFCKVIELKSFTRAAEAMFLSQPTISEHIRALEQETGQRLINRLGRSSATLDSHGTLASLPGGREIKASEAGKILFSYARKMLRLQQEALEALGHYSGNLAGRMAIGAGTIPGAYILPEKIGAFKKTHPDITITLRIAGSRTIASEILSGELEMGILGAQWRENGLIWQEIFSDELILTVAAGHPWATLREISLEQLRTEPFIMRDHSSGTRRAMGQILEQHGLNPAHLNVVAEMGTTEAIRQSVKAAIGVSILSSQAVREDIAHGSLAAVAIQGVRMIRPFYMVTRKNQALSPLCTAFIEAIEKKDQE